MATDEISGAGGASTLPRGVRRGQHGRERKQPVWITAQLASRGSQDSNVCFSPFVFDIHHHTLSSLCILIVFMNTPDHIQQSCT